MEKQKRKATKGQRERINSMLLSGLIDYDGAQEIIEKPRPGSADLNILYWEEKFPGKGEALMSFRGAFYGWKPELKPALPDLESLAKQAIFWREVKGVRIFRGRAIGELYNTLEKPLPDLFGLELGTQLYDDLWNWIGPSPWDLLERALDHSFCEDSYEDSVRNWLMGSFWFSLFYPLGFILAHKPEEATKFKPLLELWIAGNYSIGFDKEGNLLVAVA